MQTILLILCVSARRHFLYIYQICQQFDLLLFQQTIFVIIVFHKARLEQLVTLVESLLPFLGGKLYAIIEAEKAKLHRVDGDMAAGGGGVGGSSGGKSYLALAWDVFLMGMLIYFLVSIIDSSVQHHIGLKDEEQVQKLRKKQGKKTT